MNLMVELTNKTKRSVYIQKCVYYTYTVLYRTKYVT